MLFVWCFLMFLATLGGLSFVDAPHKLAIVPGVPCVSKDMPGVPCCTQQFLDIFRRQRQTYMHNIRMPCEYMIHTWISCCDGIPWYTYTTYTTSDTQNSQLLVASPRVARFFVGPLHSAVWLRWSHLASSVHQWAGEHIHLRGSWDDLRYSNPQKDGK